MLGSQDLSHGRTRIANDNAKSLCYEIYANRSINAYGAAWGSHLKLNEITRKLLSVIKNIAKTVTSILSLNLSRTNNNLSRLMRSIKDISFFLRYRLKQVLFLQELLIHPRGWGGFTEDLINKVKENKNISILNNQIVQINNGTDLCSLVTEDNNLIEFDITITLF